MDLYRNRNAREGLGCQEFPSCGPTVHIQQEKLGSEQVLYLCRAELLGGKDGFQSVRDMEAVPASNVFCWVLVFDHKVPGEAVSHKVFFIRVVDLGFGLVLGYLLVSLI